MYYLLEEEDLDFFIDQLKKYAGKKRNVCVCVCACNPMHLNLLMQLSHSKDIRGHLKTFEDIALEMQDRLIVSLHRHKKKRLAVITLHPVQGDACCYSLASPAR